MIADPNQTIPSSTGTAARPALTGAFAGTSWGAIFAGAVAASALSLILLTLGAGLGLSAASPWSGEGLEASTIGGAAVAWLMLTQIAASAVGGYMAGRLRTRWQSLHNNEVFFRDTAHGFVAWGISTLSVAVIMSMVVGGAIRTGAEAGGKVVGGVAQGAMAAAGAGAAGAASSRDDGGSGNFQPVQYAVDAMFRSQGNAPAANDEGRSQAEAARIFAASLSRGQMSDEDRRYLAQRVAAATGLTPEEADRRVSQRYEQLQTTLEQAKVQATEAADAARRAAMKAALWTFAALLLGAFAASLAATWGGRRRDDVD